MSKHTHTPGPWYIDRLGIGAAWNINDQDGNDVAFAQQRATGRDLERSANARLIAAAPDMLATLQRCLRYGDLLPELADEVRAAIAKATDPESRQ